MNYYIHSQPDSIAEVKVPLALNAHLQAKEFCRHQSNPLKAKQVYLNTLAVYAVHCYLKSMEFPSNLHYSDSWSPIEQSLMDIADLEIEGYGKLECRPILPDRKSLEIPEEVWENRIGYIAVQLDESLQEATILGFTKQVDRANISLNQLQSILDLPEYLNSLKPKSIVPETVKLTRWLENIAEQGWKTIEELYDFPQPSTFCFRSPSRLVTQTDNSLTEVSKVKIIELNSLQGSKQIALIVRITPKTVSEIDISVSVKLYPLDSDDSYLPQGLQVMILDEKEVAVMQAEMTNTETIEFKFSGERGEYFAIKLILHEVDRVEAFVI